MAIPTTLSGAEMTRVHRQAAGAPEGAAGVRPAVVVCDPALSASQPEPELAASALNALGHAAEGPCTPRANPVSTLAALEAARLIVGALPAQRRPRPRRAGARRAAGRLHDRLDRLRPAPRALADARAARAGSATARPTRSCSRTRSARSPGASRRWIERLGEAMGGDPAEFAAPLCARTRRHAAGRARRRRGGARRVRRRGGRAARARPHAAARGPRGAARAVRRRVVSHIDISVCRAVEAERQSAPEPAPAPVNAAAPVAAAIGPALGAGMGPAVNGLTTPAAVLALQRSAGNAAVTRALLARDETARRRRSPAPATSPPPAASPRARASRPPARTPATPRRRRPSPRR